MTQVARITARFGNTRKLKDALEKVGRRISIRGIRWWQSRGGIIPATAVPYVQAAAAVEGIVLTDADWRPHEVSRALTKEEKCKKLS